MYVLCTIIFTIYTLGHVNHTLVPIPPTLKEGVACEDYQKLVRKISGSAPVDFVAPNVYVNRS